MRHTTSYLQMLEYLKLLPPLTEEVRQPLGLVVVHDGHAERVERHQAQHSPVEGVRLHHAADGDAQKSLLTAEVRHRPSFGAPDTGPGHGDALGGTQRMLSVELSLRASVRNTHSPTEEMSLYCSSPGCPRCPASIPLLLMVVALFKTAGNGSLAERTATKSRRMLSLFSVC